MLTLIKDLLKKEESSPQVKGCDLLGCRFPRNVLYEDIPLCQVCIDSSVRDLTFCAGEDPDLAHLGKEYWFNYLRANSRSLIEQANANRKRGIFD